MKRLNVKNGDVIAIPLNKYKDGFGYAKYIDVLKEWNGQIDLPSILRIYNHVSKSGVDELGKINRELLMAPVALAGIKGASKFGWAVIGNEPVTKEDRFLPHVKGGWPHLSPNPERWLYYEELGNSMKQHFADYDNVKHLEKKGLLNIELVPFRITMELMKLEGKDIKKMIGKLDWLEEVEYNQSFDIPPYSKQQPSLRGRIKTN